LNTLTCDSGIKYIIVLNKYPHPAKSGMRVFIVIVNVYEIPPLTEVNGECVSVGVTHSPEFLRRRFPFSVRFRMREARAEE